MLRNNIAKGPYDCQTNLTDAELEDMSKGLISADLLTIPNPRLTVMQCPEYHFGIVSPVYGLSADDVRQKLRQQLENDDFKTKAAGYFNYDSKCSKTKEEVYNYVQSRDWFAKYKEALHKPTIMDGDKPSIVRVQDQDEVKVRMANGMVVIYGKCDEGQLNARKVINVIPENISPDEGLDNERENQSTAFSTVTVPPKNEEGSCSSAQLINYSINECSKSIYQDNEDGIDVNEDSTDDKQDGTNDNEDGTDDTDDGTDDNEDGIDEQTSSLDSMGCFDTSDDEDDKGEYIDLHPDGIAEDLYLNL